MGGGALHEHDGQTEEKENKQKFLFLLLDTPTYNIVCYVTQQIYGNYILGREVVNIYYKVKHVKA